MQFGIGFAKLFSGDLDFRKTETNFVFEFCPRGGGVWGGIRAGFAFGFFDGKREKDYTLRASRSCIFSKTPCKV